MAEKMRLGDLAVARGFITREELEDALRVQAELFREGTDRPLGNILLEKGYLREGQLDGLLKAQEEAGKKTIGPYELLSRLGEGGMGTVYKARNERTGGLVALKILARRLAQDPEYVRRFEREGRLGLKLDHQNVVLTFEVGEGEGPGGVRYHYMAIEYIEGTDFGEVLDRRGRLPEKEALEVILSVARALNHAYEHELIHRDIKPSNILLDKDGRVLLADLGLARSIAEDASRVTATGAALGSPHYISPEQARGQKDIDIRSDIYSLGATLYHMLTGKTPFEGGTAAVVIAKHLTEDLPNPRDLVPELSMGAYRLVERMMAKERENRQADPAEMVEDVYRVLAGGMPGVTLELGLSSVRPPEAVARAMRAGTRRTPTGASPRGSGATTRKRRRQRTVQAAPVGGAEAQKNLIMKVGLGALFAAFFIGVLVVGLGGKGRARPKAPGEHGEQQGLVAAICRGVDLGAPIAWAVVNRVDFDWGTGAPAREVPADGFSIRFTGVLLVPESGRHELSVESDDGFKLKLDGRTELSDWTARGATERTIERGLARGRHALRLDYFDRDGSANVRLCWRRPGRKLEIIPAEFLRHRPADKDELSRFGKLPRTKLAVRPARPPPTRATWRSQPGRGEGDRRHGRGEPRPAGLAGKPAAIVIPEGRGPAFLTRLIAGFEDDKELMIFEDLRGRAEVRRVREHATQGLHSLQMRRRKGDITRLWATASKGMRRNWSLAKNLCFDVFTEQGGPLKVRLDICDGKWQGPGKPLAPLNRRNIQLELPSGPSTVVVPLRGLVANDGRTRMDLSCTSQFQIYFLGGDPFTVYIDNIRLEFE